MKIQNQSIASHRNGICGAPFHVILFTDDTDPMLAIVFQEPWHCAVLQRDQLAAGDVAFGSNSWRGTGMNLNCEKRLKHPSPTLDETVQTKRLSVSKA